MLGGAFALIAAVTFAWTNAAVRRGVVTGTAVQATTLSIPIGVPVFFSALLMTGQPARQWLYLRVSGFDLLRGKPGARALCGA